MNLLTLYQIAIMKQTGTLNMEALYSLSEFNTADIEREVFRFEKTGAAIQLEKTINDYLKTPEEMDAEFCMEITASKLMFKDRNDQLDTYKRILQREGNNNSYIPDDTRSGFMEENY